ncbi:MAG: hypothetical protein U1C73_17070, partial [Dietzia sp.]|nr:hypothetical protein [Dietzia sp.]
MSNAFAVDPGPLWSTSPGASMGVVNTTGTTRRAIRRPTATVTATLAATAVALAAALAAPATANAQDSSEALVQL